MDRIEIDTEKKVFLLNGKPMNGVTEITINIKPLMPPEATLTMMSELDIKLDAVVSQTKQTMNEVNPQKAMEEAFVSCLGELNSTSTNIDEE